MKYSELTDTERFYADSQPGMKQYCDDHRFSNDQLVQIRYGIESGVDVTVYANPDIPSRVMAVILDYLKKSHLYTVRYNDSGDDILTVTCTAKSKQEAVDMFRGFHKNANIIDVREDDDMLPWT